MKKISLILILIFSFLFGAEKGILNIYTDKKEADIYIGNNRIGKGEITGYQLNPGSYYIKVMQGKDKIYGGLAIIKAGEETSIIADDFVDIQTAYPSKGPQKRESARIRDARGRAAIGFHFGSPASGISLRYWFTQRFGWQGIIWHTDDGTSVAGNSGNRLLVNISNKIHSNVMQNAYLAVGGGTSSYKNSNNMDEDWTYNVSEIALGFEWFRIVPDELIVSQPSVEIGYENRTTSYPEQLGRGDLKYSGFKFSYGVHIYF